MTKQIKESLSSGQSSTIRAILTGAGGGLFLVLVFAAGYFFRDFTTPKTSELSYDLLIEVDSLLQEHYLYDLPDDEQRIYGATQGLVASLGNPYTYFTEPQTAEVNTTNLAGHYGGIGVEITLDADGNFVITQVYRDNPAYVEGVAPGDIILAIDEDDFPPGTELNDLLAAIRGEVGKPVILTLLRGDETIEAEIIRADILIPSVFWRILDESPSTGYIQIVRFTNRTPEELKTALTELQDQGASSYILDLRGNTGGLVDSAVAVADQFLSGDSILYELRKTGEQQINASRNGLALDAPLVLLVNGHSASASEIVAGALQDRGRAILVGQQTYGKGSVQVILSLSNGATIRVTNAEWYTPNHNRIENDGLIPDLITEPSPDFDAEILAALEYLEN